MPDDSTKRSQPNSDDDPDQKQSVNKRRKRRRRRKRSGEEATRLADEIKALEAYEQAELETFGFVGKNESPKRPGAAAADDDDANDFNRTSTMRVDTLKDLEATIRSRGIGALEAELGGDTTDTDEACAGDSSDEDDDAGPDDETQRRMALPS